MLEPDGRWSEPREYRQVEQGFHAPLAGCRNLADPEAGGQRLLVHV